MGKRGIFVLAFVALLISGVFALAAPSPDGRGGLQVWAGTDLVGISESGTFVGGVPTFNDEYKAKGYNFIGGGLVYPMAESVSVLLGLGMANFSGSQTEAPPSPYVGQFQMDNTEQSHGADLGLRLFPGAWFGRHWQPESQDNPDGPLFWPALQAFASHDQDNLSWNLVTHTGGYAGLSARQPATDDAWGGHYQVTVPLQKHLSLYAVYDHTYQNTETSTYGTWVYKDSYEDTTLGLTAYMQLFIPDAPHAYIPGFGREGQMRLMLDYYWDENISAARGNYQTVSASLGFAVAENWGLEAIYHSVKSLNPYFRDGGGYTFQLAKRNDTQQRIEARITYSFGEAYPLGGVNTPAQEPPAAEIPDAPTTL